MHVKISHGRIFVNRRKVLQGILQRLENIEQSQLAILKELHQLFPKTAQSNVPEFISIQDARAKYYVSHFTINNKIKLFKEVKKREIDRLQSGGFYLINEIELQEALRIRSYVRQKLLTGIMHLERKKRNLTPISTPKKQNPCKYRGFSLLFVIPMVHISNDLAIDTRALFEIFDLTEI
jgi:hypothetical protein